MSSLGTKIKEALRGPESQEAARGDVDHRTPGSFPTDDVAADEANPSYSSGSQHNKLHKAQDPRGWSDSDPAAQGQHQSGSNLGGVSFAQPRTGVPPGGTGEASDIQDGKLWEGNSGVTQRDYAAHGRGFGEGAAAGAAAGGLAAHEAPARHQGDDRVDEPNYTTSSARATEPVGAAGASGASGASRASGIPGVSGLSGAQEPTRASQESTGTANKDHPYWGDISSGGGVYNTVTGHGSAEDESQQHHPRPLNANARENVSSGTGPSALAGGATADSSQSQQRQFQLASAGQAAQAGAEDKHDRRKEELAGAGVGVGAGAAAYEANKKWHEGQANRDQRATEGDAQSSAQPGQSKSKDEKEGFLGGILHRDHQQHEKEPKHTHREEKHAHHEERQGQATDPRLHNRPTGTDDAAIAAAVAYSANLDAEEREKKKKAHAQQHQEAAAPVPVQDRAQEHHHHHHHQQQEQQQQEEQQPQQKHSKLAALFHRGSTDKGKDDSNAVRDNHGEHSRSVDEPHEASTAAALAAIHARERHGGHDDPQVAAASARDPLSQQAPAHGSAGRADQAAPSKHSNVERDLAAAGAGGAAGYGASRLVERHEEDRRQPQSQSQPQTSGLASSTGQSAASGTTTGASRQNDPQYNVLGSGTASGVRGDNASSTPASTGQQGPLSTSSRDTPAKSDHRGAEAAAAGVGAAGLGTAAYYATRDDKKQPPAATQQQFQSTPAAASSTTRNDPGTTTTSDRSAAAAAASTPAQATNSGRSADQFSDSHRGPGAGTDAALGGAALGTTAAAASRHSDRDDSGAGAGTLAGGAGDGPATKHVVTDSKPADPSSGGQYNVLSSGTPSGVAVPGGNSSAAPTQTATSTSTSNPSDRTGDRNAAAAVGGAGLAAAGGTAAHEARKDDGVADRKPVAQQATSTTPADTRRENASQPVAAPAGVPQQPPTGSGSKVIHKCTKCGEDNDISSYFQNAK